MNDIIEEKIKKDKIEQIGQSTVHHGHFSNRIFLLKYHPDDGATVIKKMNELASENGYSKMIAKVPESAQPLFLIDGFVQEAFIPGYFNGDEDVFFMSKFLTEKRAETPEKQLKTLAKLLSEPPSENDQELPEKFTLEMTRPEHAKDMTKIFKEVFATYPFPVTDPSYLVETMEDGSVVYFGVWQDGQLVGLSSAEVDKKNKNAEMTDFAVRPDFRGQKLAWYLLEKMEEELKKMNYKTLYTIARLNSPGMNRTFINHGYNFSGTLINNTNISGQIESMNVYYKTI
ncbi:MAG TPA: putative beta-lysine N-acetyltransferase [Sunxiuqinia sp.]|nr:putative beta-lysine N-acetyltransferase [Sunxiuqinia sp.]